MSYACSRSLTLAVLITTLALAGCAGPRPQHAAQRPAPPPVPPPPLVAVRPQEACAVLAWGAQPGQFPGNSTAARINEEDCQNAWTARQAALAPATATHEPIYWNTEATGNYGSFTPTTDIPPKGALCRWYEQMLVVDGNATKTQAWSCLQHDGSWQMAR